MYQEAIESLSLVQNSISMSDIDRICTMIYEAKKVHMLGYQFNKIISNDFQMKNPLISVDRQIYVRAILHDQQLFRLLLGLSLL